MVGIGQRGFENFDSLRGVTGTVEKSAVTDDRDVEGDRWVGLDGKDDRKGGWRGRDEDGSDG